MPKLQVTVDWDAIQADPVEFTTKMLRRPDGTPCIPHDAQVAIMRGYKRDTTVVTGRQFGKSTVLEWLPTWFGVTKPNRVIMILAPTLEQARIIFNGIRWHFDTNPVLKRLLAEKPKNSPFPEIKLKNGSLFMARGLNSPEYVRGNRPHLVIIDECAFVKDGSLKDAVEPSMTVTGKEPGSALIRISSPFGDGEFKEAWDTAGKRLSAGSPRYARFHFTSYDNPHADRDYLEEVKERYGEDSAVWQAEYLGNFQDSDAAVFPTAELKAAYERWDDAWKFPLAPIAGHRYVQGVDLANKRDYFVASMLDRTDKDAVVLSRMDRFRRRGYAHYKSVIKTNYLAYHNARTIIDATTIAESFVEEVRAVGVTNLQGYAISSNSAKWEIVQELGRMFSEHRLIIPFDKDILQELAHFQYKITEAKVMRMEAPKNEHDDIVMSLALGAHLCAVPSTLGTFRAVSTTPKPQKSTVDPRTVDPWHDLCAG